MVGPSARTLQSDCLAGIAYKSSQCRGLTLSISCPSPLIVAMQRQQSIGPTYDMGGPPPSQVNAQQWSKTLTLWEHFAAPRRGLWGSRAGSGDLEDLMDQWDDLLKQDDQASVSQQMQARPRDVQRILAALSEAEEKVGLSRIYAESASINKYSNTHQQYPACLDASLSSKFLAVLTSPHENKHEGQLSCSNKHTAMGTVMFP